MDRPCLDWELSGNLTELPVSRRQALQLLGGGIVILFADGDLRAQSEGEPSRATNALPTDYNAFLRIGEDGEVTCFTGKIEMGQGVVTSLAQMLADELDVALDSVHMVMGDTDLCPWDMGTWGSLSTRAFGPHLRAAGAEAKAVLLALAAERLDRPVADLAVEAGVVFDRAEPSRRVAYSTLAQGRRIARHLSPAPPLKTPAEMRVIGQPVLRRDAVAKVTGAAQYAADIRLDGMLCARLLRPPAHGARLQALDVSPVSQVSGARVVQDGELVAVLHDHPDQAERALALIEARWDRPEPTVDDQTIFTHLFRAAPPGEEVARGGDLARGESQAVEVVEATYLNSYVAHAPIEPHAALAVVEGSKTTVWASTQNPFGVRNEVAEALGCQPEDVRVITPFVGGGFGGKARNLQAVEAARLARAAGRPVQVAYTRAEEFFADSFRPAAMVRIRSGLTEAGRIAFWEYHVYYAGARGAECFYDIADHATLAYPGGWGGGPGTHPFATGAWRAPGNNTNTFARESHIDTLAAKAGVDPVAFRLAHLRDEKMRGVLLAAAERFGWTKGRLGPGRGCGVALGIDAGTWVASLAEVQVDEATGAVRVERVVCAQNMGLVVNPQGARIQMEGCITMGLGYALGEEVHFRGGEILDRNFDTYTLPRFSWLPRIETVLIEDRNDPPQGGGEPAIITMGAVVANAICAATGARLLQLPMTPARVIAARG
ncbi:MAG: molybdopterin cofactor-binding domain-containing protein [Candidatus Latescibacterota bacterium]|jgi:CO/xanthine dehydrogenase Mo-binding subunit